MAAVKLTKETFRDFALGEKPALIEFQAPWCVYCRRIASAFDKVAEQYSGVLNVGMVDIDDDEALADEYGVELVPTLILYKNGQAMGSVTAPDSKARIDEFIKEHLEN